jgi:hypothetical protein
MSRGKHDFFGLAVFWAGRSTTGKRRQGIAYHFHTKQHDNMLIYLLIFKGSQKRLPQGVFKTHCRAAEMVVQSGEAAVTKA